MMVKKKSFVNEEELFKINSSVNFINSKYYYYKDLLLDSMNNLGYVESMNLLINKFIEIGKENNSGLEYEYRDSDEKLLLNKFLLYFEGIVDKNKTKKSLIFSFLVFTYWIIYYQYLNPHFFISLVYKEVNRNKEKYKVKDSNYISPKFLAEVKNLQKQLKILGGEDDFLEKFYSEVNNSEEVNLENIFKKYKGALEHEKEICYFLEEE